MWFVLALSMALPLAGMAVGDDSNQLYSPPASAQDVSQAKDYGVALGTAWLKSAFDIDVDDLVSRLKDGVSIGQQISINNDLNAMSASDSLQAPDGLVYSMNLRLEEYDDLRRMQSNVRDIPFAVRFDSYTSLVGQNFRLRTSLYLPLSWKDEMRAEAMLPLPSLEPQWMGSLLDLGGFDSAWALKSTYGNHLGVNSVDTGLGTQWMKILDLNYEFKVRFGEENYEESQWLKLGTKF
jgi:hypothetical protein